MTTETWTSILLVAVGAAISLASTLIADAVRSRRARVVRAEERAEAQRKAGSPHAQAVLAELDDLWAEMNNARRLRGTEHGFEVDTEHSRRVYRTFLLIPDAVVRQLVQNGIYALNNYGLLYPMPDRKPAMIDEELAILLAMRQSLARWIRGEEPELAHVQLLQQRADFVDERMAGD